MTRRIQAFACMAQRLRVVRHRARADGVPRFKRLGFGASAEALSAPERMLFVGVEVPRSKPVGWLGDRGIGVLKPEHPVRHSVHGALTVALHANAPYTARLTDAGWSSLAARRAHNPKVAGSNPAPATISEGRERVDLSAALQRASP